MAVITAEAISGLTLELLARQLVLPRTVARPPGAEFGGPSGGVVNVRVRQPRDARVQATAGDPINYDPIDEASVAVTLTHLYDATQITDEDLSLSIENFAQQVSLPQVTAVSAGAENLLAAVMNAIPANFTFSPDVNDPDDEARTAEALVLSAREYLARKEVPLGNRWLAVSPEFATSLLKSNKVTAVNESGSASALRDAVIGRLYGFTVVESAALTESSAVAYHESAFAFANRAPVNPNGAANSATASRDGIALRQLFDFDPGHLSDVSVVSTFAGAAAITEDGNAVTLGNLPSRAVRLLITGTTSS